MLAQSHSGAVQLGFDVTEREAEHFGDFLRLITVNMMKNEHLLITRRQRRDSVLKLKPANGIAGLRREPFEFARDRRTLLMVFVERMN